MFELVREEPIIFQYLTAAMGTFETNAILMLGSQLTDPKQPFRRCRYGQITGKHIKDGQDVNLLQVKQGYAWHYKRFQKDQSKLDRLLYSSAETEAREKTIGLWAVPAVAPWEFRKGP